MSSALRKYILIRIMMTIPMILILISVVFFVMRVLPGDPALAVLRDGASDAQIEAFREAMGLNKPLSEQYVEFVTNLLQFNFGISMTRPVTVIQEITTFLPATIELAIYSMFVITFVGVLSGAYAAQHRKSTSDYVIRVLGIILYSIPIFWLGLMFQMFFGAKLGWLPVSGRLSPGMIPNYHITGMYTFDALIKGDWPVFIDAISHIILPSLTLGLIIAGVFTRLTRANMLDVLESDFITAGRARGLKERILVYKHGLRNAAIPIVTLLGLQFAVLLSGAILTETTYSWPGLGRLLVQRIFDRDFAVVQGGIVFFAVIVAGASLFVDIIYGFLDPRIRY
ncbi:ABC transporter permease [Chloroflexota bacterium]